MNIYDIFETKKGLYYNVNKRKQAGTSRSKNAPEAPSAEDWKNAAKTAKEDINEGIEIVYELSEGAGKPLTIEQLAMISDAALDSAYGYGRSTPGNTFGWQANLASAAYAKQMIDRGVTDVEAISDAIHKGWWSVAQKFVDNPDQFSDTEKLRANGKFDKKMADRKAQMVPFNQLTKDQQDIDTVVARAMLQAITGGQGVAEGQYEIHHHDPEGRLKARYHHGSEYTDDVIRKDADYHQKRNPKDTIKVFKDKKPMESQGVEEGYVDFHGNRENTPQIVWWRKPAGDNIYWKVFPTLSMASRATTNLANSLYKKYGKYLETGNVNFDPTNSAHCRAIDANKYMTESIKQKIQELEEHIGKVKSGYRLYSHTGKNLGTFPNKAGAKKHEREVQYFKHASEGIDEGSQSFHNGMQVKLTPEYADRPDEIFTVSHCDQERGRCWIGDEQGRGWSAKFDQLIPVEDDDDDELDINENYLHQLKLAGYEIL